MFMVDYKHPEWTPRPCSSSKDVTGVCWYFFVTSQSNEHTNFSSTRLPKLIIGMEIIYVQGIYEISDLDLSKHYKRNKLCVKKYQSVCDWLFNENMLLHTFYRCRKEQSILLLYMEDVLVRLDYSCSFFTKKLYIWEEIQSYKNNISLKPGIYTLIFVPGQQ